MNKDQVKGTAKEIAGKAQQVAAEVTGNPSTLVKGVAKEAEGKAQKDRGDAKETAKEAAKDAAR